MAFEGWRRFRLKWRFPLFLYPSHPCQVTYRMRFHHRARACSSLHLLLPTLTVSVEAKERNMKYAPRLCCVQELFYLWGAAPFKAGSLICNYMHVFISILH